MANVNFSDIRSRKSMDEGSVKIFDQEVSYSVHPAGESSPGYISPTHSLPTSDSDDGGEKVLKVEVEETLSGGEDFNGGDDDKKSLITTSEIDKDGVVREYETALKHIGFGFFHILLLVINGVALSSDAVEVLSISFVFPKLSKRNEWGIGSAEEALLGSIIFLGMLFGSYVWGGLADIIGRRTTIVLSLLISAAFGFFSAFLPWFGLFVFFRFLSGFG